MEGNYTFQFNNGSSIIISPTILGSRISLCSYSGNGAFPMFNLYNMYLLQLKENAPNPQAQRKIC